MILGDFQLMVSVAGGVAIPLIIYLMMRQDHNQTRRFGDLNTRLDHLDRCVDELKQTVASGLVPRTETAAALLTLRESISADTKGLHDRIMRLEDNIFQGARHDTRPR